MASPGPLAPAVPGRARGSLRTGRLASRTRVHGLAPPFRPQFLKAGA